MKRRLAAMLSVALLLALPAAVHAAPPEGQCPRPFNTATIEALLVLLENPDARATLETIDANDNQTLCWQAHPEVSRAEEQLGFIILNVVDDAARNPHQ